MRCRKGGKRRGEACGCKRPCTFHDTDTPRCQAKTARGRNCLRAAPKGKRYCYTHINGDSARRYFCEHPYCINPTQELWYDADGTHFDFCEQHMPEGGTRTPIKTKISITVKTIEQKN